VLPRPAPASQHGEIIDAVLVAKETAATFSLSSVFLVMTLAAVAAGVLAAAPGLGILFLVIATPALARTMVVSSQRKRLGVAMTPGAKILHFLHSTALTLVILASIVICVTAALVVALFVACANAIGGHSGFNSDAGFVWGAIAGGPVALAGIVRFCGLFGTGGNGRR
jgi:hypothetical protein